MSPAALEELNALSRAYESVATQLRLATTGLGGAAAPLPFDLTQFRAVANASFGVEWAALDYYLTDEWLTIVVVTPGGLETVSRKLTSFDRAVLERCAQTEPDARELVYRGTLHNQPVPAPGEKYLQHLYRLLIPSGLTASTLVIAPHGALHTLPFQALLDHSTYLIEHHKILYAPSLQTLQHLLKQPSRGAISHPLVIGISGFGEHAAALPCVPAEVDRLCQLFEGHGLYLRETEATRQRLRELQAAGALEKFDLIHLATHAVLDGAAPHQSRVLLHDDPLNALDILDLSLNARLVTLSACQTALGTGGHGDEWIGLARAFFYAGTQALLVTQWSVEDHANADLIERFYRHWNDGIDAAAALQQAQIEMLRAGHPPYHWAAVVLMGHP